MSATSIPRFTRRLSFYGAALALATVLLGSCAHVGPTAPAQPVSDSAPSAASGSLDLGRLDRELGATWSPSPTATEPELELFRLSPYVSADVFPFVEPATRALRMRLAMVERAAQAAGLPVHHTFQALYGSGFLLHNPVGNDLDYEYGIDLGHLRLQRGHEGDAADLVLDRMEAYLSVLEQVFRQQDDPALAVLNFRLLRDGRWKQRDVLRQRMVASLVDVAARRTHMVLVDSLYGLRVPTVLTADESYVYETTRIELMSNLIRTVDWMSPGLRAFQVMFHWSCDLEIVDEQGRTLAELPGFPFHPVFVPSGKVLSPTENPLGTVPVDRESAIHVSETVLDPARMVERRLASAEILLAEVDRNLAAGDPLKALKRLHQAGDALAPGLPPELTTALYAALDGTLFDPQLVACGEVAKLADNAADVFEIPPLLGIYVDSYDLQRTLGTISLGLERAARRGMVDAASADQSGARLRSLQGELDDFPTAEQRASAGEALKAVKDLAESCEAARMPSVESVATLRDGIKDGLRAAGWQPLPVYGLADGTLGVLAADLGELPADGLSAAAVAAGGPPFTYRVIVAAEVPLDRRGQAVEPSWTLWLRPSPTPAEALASRALTTALEHDDERFERLPPSPGRGLRMAAERQFVERFGAAGAAAWAASRTGGDALLALLGVADRELAERLLAGHLALVADAAPVAAFLPAEEGSPALGVALVQALAATSERGLLGLATGRASGGRRGLTPGDVLELQGEMRSLEDSLVDLAAGRGVIERHDSDPARGDRYLVRCTTAGTLVELNVNATRRAASQPRIGVTVRERAGVVQARPVMLRFDVSTSYGAGIDVQPADPRVDWGVHGALPSNPLVSDHHFFFGLPKALRRPHGPRDREALMEIFESYVETRFVPLIVGRLAQPAP